MKANLVEQAKVEEISTTLVYIIKTVLYYTLAKSFNFSLKTFFTPNKLWQKRL